MYGAENDRDANKTIHSKDFAEIEGVAKKKIEKSATLAPNQNKIKNDLDGDGPSEKDQGTKLSLLGS